MAAVIILFGEALCNRKRILKQIKAWFYDPMQQLQQGLTTYLSAQRQLHRV
jgi:hypothetical protein